MLRRPLGSTLFPYTTLFRSFVLEAGKRVAGSCVAKQDLSMVTYKLVLADGARAQMGAMKLGDRWYLSYFTGLPAGPRSEEHTSELQSQSNLVCRLLLEKKNK